MSRTYYWRHCAALCLGHPLNRQIQLAARPVGAPTATDFHLATSAVPTISAGKLLLRTVYLSLDPYMRGRMSEAASYAAAVAIGSPIVGMTVCRVHSSQHAGFAVGDWVLAYTGWQGYGHRYLEYAKDMSQWVGDGKIKVREDLSMAWRTPRWPSFGCSKARISKS